MKTKINYTVCAWYGDNDIEMSLGFTELFLAKIAANSIVADPAAHTVMLIDNSTGKGISF